MEDRRILKWVFYFCIIFFFSSLADTAPVETIEAGISVLDALEFLQDYGYLEAPGTASGRLLSESDFVTSLKEMQRFAGIKETGKLDNETVELMKANRCGVSDTQPFLSSKRQRRFAIHSKKWEKSVLTWRIHNYGNDGLKKAKVRETFKNALEKWSNVTNLSFKEITTGEPDIWFKFVKGNHGDNSPFKVPYSRVIAHAFYPKYGTTGLAGDVHFNDAKRFAIASNKGKNLLWITLHELGHSIGLYHSSDRDSIMYPYYRGYDGEELELTADDINGAQALYGVKVRTTPAAPEHSTMRPPTTAKCFSRISAIFLGGNKKTYMFSSDKLWILNKDLGLEKGPISVGKVFKGMTSVDAAFRRNDGNTMLFSRKSFYVYNIKNAYISGPNPIKEHFNGLSNVDSIDAAFVWPGNQKLYVFKSKHYWRYSAFSNGRKYSLDIGYPRKIRHGWTGIPHKNINGIFTWNHGFTYAFKGDKYYALNKGFGALAGYPKQVSKDWTKIPPCTRMRGMNIEEEANSSASKLSFQLSLTFIFLIISCFTVRL